MTSRFLVGSLGWRGPPLTQVRRRRGEEAGVWGKEALGFRYITLEMGHPNGDIL